MYFIRLWVSVVAVLAVVRDTKLLAGVAAAVVLLVAPVASAVFYDFESPTYTGGVTIDGQDGWAGGIFTIITSVDTDQLLRIGSNSIASHSVAGADFDDLTTVSVRTFITNNTSSYGELQLFDSTNTQYVRIGIQNANDHFYAFDNVGYNQFDTTPVSGGNYYNVVVTLDFAAQKYRTTYTHEISAALHADTGFISFIAPTTIALAEGGRIDLQGGANSGRFAYFDKLSIAEPNIAISGDYNGNGVVDSADYVVWRKNQGGPGGSVSVGDSEPDGDVDDTDYAFWRARFGNTSGSGSGAGLGASEIPEPSAVLLVSLGLFLAGTLVSARCRGTRF